MDFAMLPPEINSGRMYAGPGAGTMLAAASAWDGLATELYSTAASYGSVISELTAGSWLGPSSVSMAAAAAPYVAWLSATAAQAELSATQAKAAAAAYEAAFAMTVHPAVIAANRSLLMTLVATNFFGQNTPAIAATEVHYAEMWAQDATAMYGYAGASSAASTLTPFTPPPPTTNLAGLAGQAAALAQTAGTSAATHTQTALSQLITAVPSALHGVASSNPAMVTFVGPASYETVSYSINLGRAVGALQAARDRFIDGGLVSVLGDTVGPGPLQSILGGMVGATPEVSASMGQAASIGGLSVPQSWAAVSPAAMVSPAANVSAAPAAAAGAPETAMAGLPGAPEAVLLPGPVAP
ncbi:PPE family protein [Mycobacterium sp.]|uniref:PPE family protein n=1 Tax=Mycobacterium sp. TaxID=1785 RepID=UPI003F94FA74